MIAVCNFLLFFSIILINLNRVNCAENEVLQQGSKTHPNGDYDYKYILANGAQVKVMGKRKEVNGNHVYQVTGSYSFEINDKLYSVEYVADENGYRAKTVISTIPDIVDKLINPKAVGSILG